MATNTTTTNTNNNEAITNATNANARNTEKTSASAAKAKAKAEAVKAKAEAQAKELEALGAELAGIAKRSGDNQPATCIDSAEQANTDAAKHAAIAEAARKVGAAANKIGLKASDKEIKSKAKEIRDSANAIVEVHDGAAKAARARAKEIDAAAAKVKAQARKQAAKESKEAKRDFAASISDLAKYERTLKGYIEGLISGFLSAEHNGADASEDDAQKHAIFGKLMRSLSTEYNDAIKPRAAAKYFARIIAEKYPYKDANGTLLKLTAKGAKEEQKVITTRANGTTYTASRKLQHVVAVPASASEIVKVYYSVALAGATVAPANLIASDLADKEKKPTYYLATEAAKYDTCEIFTNFEIACDAKVEEIEHAEFLKKQARLIDKASALGLKITESCERAEVI